MFLFPQSTQIQKNVENIKTLSQLWKMVERVKWFLDSFIASRSGLNAFEFLRCFPGWRMQQESSTERVHRKKRRLPESFSQISTHLRNSSVTLRKCKHPWNKKQWKRFIKIISEFCADLICSYRECLVEVIAVREGSTVIKLKGLYFCLFVDLQGNRNLC